MKIGSKALGQNVKLGMKYTNKAAKIGGKALDAGMLVAAGTGQLELLPEMAVARRIASGLEKISN